MKTIFKKYELKTSGAILHLSLTGIVRALGLEGAQTVAELPIAVLNLLKVTLVSPSVSGAVVLTSNNLKACHYEVDGNDMVIYLSKLCAGVHTLEVLAEYGTMCKSLFTGEIVAPSNVPFLRKDGVYTPLERYEEKDQDEYKAYAYKHGEVLVWVEEMDFNHLITAFVADGLDKTLADATEESDCLLVKDANVSVYDDLGSVEFAAADTIGDYSKIGDLADLETEAKENIVAAINELAEVSEGHVYGVRHYFRQSSTSLARFSNNQEHDLHMILPVQSKMRRCVVNDAGEVVYYLDHDDSTKKEDGTDAVLDGTDGQVMVEIPEHYRRHRIVTNEDEPSYSYYETAISLLPFAGAFKVNKCYISAYEAALDRTNSKLASVVNDSEQYRGGNNTADWDGTYRSLLGKPATNINITNFRAYARKRGEKWNCQEWDIYNTLYWLYVVEYANLNCQLAYNANRDGDGHHQGGLGDGVSSISDWIGYNNTNPFIPCGTTNSLGNSTGVVAYKVLNEDGTTRYTPNVPSYRGVENPFGHVLKWTDGFLAVGNGTTQEYFICHDRTKFASKKNDAYESKGLSAGSDGYVKEIARNDEGDILATKVGGGNTTYFADYYMEYHAAGSTYGVCSGGSAWNNAGGGLACLDSRNAPSDAAATLGSRLCWSDHDTIYEEE